MDESTPKPVFNNVVLACVESALYRPNHINMIPFGNKRILICVKTEAPENE